MINQIGKITLYVNNQEEAKKFFIEKLGFVVKLEQPMGPQMTWLEVGPGKEAFTSFIIYDKNLMMQQNPNTNVGHPSVLLSTKDIDKTYEEFKDRGVNVGEMKSMPYGKMFNFLDMDGNNYLVREDK